MYINFPDHFGNIRTPAELKRLRYSLSWLPQGEYPAQHVVSRLGCACFVDRCIATTVFVCLCCHSGFPMRFKYLSYKYLQSLNELKAEDIGVL